MRQNTLSLIGCLAHTVFDVSQQTVTVEVVVARCPCEVRLGVKVIPTYDAVTMRHVAVSQAVFGTLQSQEIKNLFLQKIFFY